LAGCLTDFTLKCLAFNYFFCFYIFTIYADTLFRAFEDPFNPVLTATALAEILLPVGCLRISLPVLICTLFLGVTIEVILVICV
jgi:hypothetical protein